MNFLTIQKIKIDIIWLFIEKSVPLRSNCVKRIKGI